MRVVRRTARAILIDPDGRLVLFRRTLPKRKPYWSTPGGGVDAGDDSIEAALHRELAEELGATVDRVQQVFLTSPPRGGGITVAHFFVCRLVSMDLSLRTGEEFTNPAKGRYDVDRIDLHGKKLSRYPLQPLEVKEFILANRQALLMAALDDETPPLTSPPAPGTAPPPVAHAQPPRAAEPSGAPDHRDAAAPPADVAAKAPDEKTPRPPLPESQAPQTQAPQTPAPQRQIPQTQISGTPMSEPAGRVFIGPIRRTTPVGEAEDARAPTVRRRRVRPAVLEIVDGEATHDPGGARERPERRRPRWWRRRSSHH